LTVFHQVFNRYSAIKQQKTTDQAQVVYISDRGMISNVPAYRRALRHRTQTWIKIANTTTKTSRPPTPIAIIMISVQLFSLSSAHKSFQYESKVAPKTFVNIFTQAKYILRIYQFTSTHIYQFWSIYLDI